MPKNYQYTQRRFAPPLHRHVMMNVALGKSDKEVAVLCDITPETVKKIREHDPNAEWLTDTEAVVAGGEELLYVEHDEIVRGSLTVTRAVIKEAIQYDDEGEPTLRMVTKKDGSTVPRVPASLLKTVMTEPLDHDPNERFTKKLTLKKGKSDQGFGGAVLSKFKTAALSEGFTPPQVSDAEFRVVRDGVPVLDASATVSVEFDGEETG